MIEIYSDKIITPELEEGAIYNDEYDGFHQDYLVLHCLLKIYKPRTFFELGTNMGTGTNIIKNALGEDAEVFSLDLPTELSHVSLQHPISEGKGDLVGSYCKLPFTQLRGDSMKFVYSQYPCEGYYIDGEHTTKNVHYETREILKQKPNIVIFHDSDMPEVMQGIINGWNDAENGWDYELYRVFDTRISYLLKIDK